MKKIYVIDACALINAAHNYNMTKKSFAHIWEALDEMIKRGELISSIEIMEELKDDELCSWAKQRKDCFIPLTKEIQEKAIEVLKKYPTLIKIRSTGNSNADPFLIATAALKDGIIVTDEKFGDSKNKNYKIPNVCEELDIPFMTLHKFLDQILE